MALVRSHFLMGPLYGDEKHFFPNTLSLIPFRMEKLKTFRELSSPAFFVAFSYVLQALGRNVAWCRLLVLLSLVGCAIVYRSLALKVARRSGAAPAAAPASLILLLTFPYFVGCGIYYYTDIPALFFALLAYSAHERQKTGGAVLWATLALHCRQVYVFLPLAVGAFEAWRWWRTRERQALSRAALWLVPVASLLPYVLLWHAPTPMRIVNPRLADLPAIMPWHLAYMLAACGLYLLPLAILSGGRHWSWGKLGCVAAGVAFFIAFPPRPNLYFQLVAAPIATLGFLDSALRALVGGKVEMVILAAGAGSAAALHYELLFRSHDDHRDAFKWIIAAFWFVSLFDHLAWDKYILPVLPLLYLAALRHPAICPAGAPAEAGTTGELWSWSAP
jgi:hypothetical protein